MTHFLHDIEALTFNAHGDHSAEDFIEAADKAIEIINKYKQQAQGEICDQVEELVDSFGGRDCSMRELKGE